jgi:3-deoxy-manno-octulosonate cytidylyltransferase (CMP-KDO synthetase)
MSPEILILIPSRYGSTRLPGKPLLKISGKPMIQHVYERLCEKYRCIVVTDSEKIIECVKSFNGEVIMTSEACRNGTLRCSEAIQKLKSKNSTIPKYIVNVQGDEPLINVGHIDKLISKFVNTNFDIGTLCTKASLKNLNSNSNSYVVFDSNNKAIFFSRYQIPFDRAKNNIEKFKHVGVYIFKSNVLSDLINSTESKLEKYESLEQLGWLENGYNIQVTTVDNDESTSVDTQEDLEYVRELYKNNFGLTK